MPGNCPICSKSVYINEEILFDSKPWHRACFKCVNCGKQLNLGIARKTGNGLNCDVCLVKAAKDDKTLQIVNNKISNMAPPNASRFTPAASTGDICPVCNKKVYFAEQTLCLGKVNSSFYKKYHKLCLKCTDCKKLMDPSVVCDHEGVHYCKGCYGKRYGPKGYGYGQGAGTLTRTE